MRGFEVRFNVFYYGFHLLMLAFTAAGIWQIITGNDNWLTAYLLSFGVGAFMSSLTFRVMHERQNSTVQVVDRHFGSETLELSPFQQFSLWLLGRAKLYERAKRGWTEPLPFYVSKCTAHGIMFVDYPHGYKNYLTCPLCWKEQAEKWTME